MTQNGRYELYIVQLLLLLLLLHLFNGLFFQDNLHKPAPEKQNHSGKTNLD